MGSIYYWLLTDVHEICIVLLRGYTLELNLVGNNSGASTLRNPAEFYGEVY